jgi:hypothetical protein
MGNVKEEKPDKICRVGQNRMYRPFMTVCLVMYLPGIPYIHRVYMALANPAHL